MKLKKQSSQNPVFEDLYAMVRTMENLLKGEETDLTLEELFSFQDKDGSFGLFDSQDIPNEAIIDFINVPTHIAGAILMKEYLKGNKEVKDKLENALRFTRMTGLQGHGYDFERGTIKSLEIFISGGLAEFLEKEKTVCPGFHNMIHNILHMYEANLLKNCTFGPWREDYSEDWRRITNALKPSKRFYIAYGSNMNKDQMQLRCPDAKIIGKTYLNNWKLTMPFYANIQRTKGAKTPCLVWEITKEDEKKLDRYEGYPNLYEKKELLIKVNKTFVTGMVYIMTAEYTKEKRQPREGYADDIKKRYLDAGFTTEEFYEALA